MKVQAVIRLSSSKKCFIELSRSVARAYQDIHDLLVSLTTASYMGVWAKNQYIYFWIVSDVTKSVNTPFPQFKKSGLSVGVLLMNTKFYEGFDCKNLIFLAKNFKHKIF